MAPSVLFNENQVTQDLLRPNSEHRPSDRLVCLASQFSVSRLKAMQLIVTCFNVDHVYFAEFPVLSKLRNQSHRRASWRWHLFHLSVGYVSDHKLDFPKILVLKFTTFLKPYRKCRHKKTKVQYAVKIVSRRADSSREVKLLRLCQGHPNIVQLHDVYHDEVRFVSH